MSQQAGVHSMRYQQVYNRSLFTNLDSAFIYLSTIQITAGGSPVGCAYSPWGQSNVQINVSTTLRPADGLSSNFVENVGADDTIVFGPGSLTGDIGRQLIQFTRPFRYDPALGNLLLDVRVFDASGPPPPPPPTPLCIPNLEAENLPSDECSRVWSTNVNASIADHIDSVGFDTILEFSPIPSLRVYTSNFSGTNVLVLEWPSQPAVFELQQSFRLQPASWQKVPTNGFYYNPPVNTYFFPESTAAPLSYFRLFWSGQ